MLVNGELGRVSSDFKCALKFKGQGKIWVRGDYIWATVQMGHQTSHDQQKKKKKERKEENRLRSESESSEKYNPNQKTDKKQRARGLPGGPGIKNLSSNVRDASLIASGGTKIPHVQWQKKKKYLFCFK